MNRVLVIGAGRRAQEAILPAIHCLEGGTVELAGLHTRTVHDVSLFGGAFHRTTTNDLAAHDFAGIDTIVVSVSRAAVPDVLRDLASVDTAHSTLMLDTPVLERDQLGSATHFAEYRRVLASEDCYALPNFLLARRLVVEGTIGALRQIYLFHSGYRHHALASLRQLTGAGRPRSITVKRWTPACAELNIRFPGGVHATIVEPRRYGVGRLLLAGDTGLLADYAIGKHGTEIGYRMDEAGRYLGLTVDGQPEPTSEIDEAFASLGRAELVDPSLMGQLKILGFMELLAGLERADGLRYDAHDAIQDNISLAIAERVGVFGDLGVRGHTVFGGALGLAARLSRSLPATRR